MSNRESKKSSAQNEWNGPFSDAIETLRLGDVIVFPTETLYGLGANALDREAVERVFQLKGRDPLNPIPVLVADQEMLHTLVADIPPTARVLMEHFWPGPLTLVLPASKHIPARLLNPEGKVGVRISSRPTATKLVRTLGSPLTATSANPSGRPPARTVDEAKNYFAGKVKIFIDGGTLRSATGSTVVEIFKDSIKIIREGEITAAKLKLISRKTVL